MAVTARFEADFSQFLTEAQKGNAALQQIESSSQRVAVAMDAMRTVAGAFGVSLGIGGIIEFGREVLAAGDEIMKMSDQTGLSTEAVQRFQYIAGQSGSSVESLVGAVQNLQQRLGDENSGAAGALGKLNINFDEFKTLNPYAQMIAAADGIRQITDPTEQASVAAALFGKTWKEILPAIKSNMAEVGAQATVMKDDVVKGLDRLGDEWKQAGQAAKAWGGMTLMALADVGTAMGDFLSQFDPAHLGIMTSELHRIYGALNDPDGLKGAFAALKPITASAVDSIQAVGMSVAEQKQAWDDLTESNKENLAINQKMHDAMLELASAGQTWQQTVETIDGAIVDAIKGYLAAGVSQAALATAYGLTAAQVKAVGSALRDETTALAEAQQLNEKIAADSAMNWASYFRDVAAMGVDAVEQAKAGTQRWLTDQIAAHVLAKTDTADFYDFVYAEAALKNQKIELDALQSDVHSRAHFELVAAQAEAAYARAAASSGQYTDKELQRLRDIAEAARRAALDFGSGFTDAAGRVLGALDPVVGKLNAITAAAAAAAAAMNSFSLVGSPAPDKFKDWTEEMKRNAGYIDLYGKITPLGQAAGLGYSGGARAAGGPVIAGVSYAVGEHGTEMFTPGASGFITPNGGGGVTVNNVINIVDTEANLARRVGAVITQSVLQGQKLRP